MTRVNCGKNTNRRHSKILNLAKGFLGSHSKLFRIANQQLMRALRYSYQDRRKKKSIFRKLWITRINIRSRKLRVKYSLLIFLMKRERLNLNRKVLSTEIIFPCVLKL